MPEYLPKVLISNRAAPSELEVYRKVLSTQRDIFSWTEPKLVYRRLMGRSAEGSPLDLWPMQRVQEIAGSPVWCPCEDRRVKRELIQCGL